MSHEQKEFSVLSHVISIFILPFNATLVIPILLLYVFRGVGGWEGHLLYSFVMISVGIICIAFGLSLVVMTIKQFVKRGKGTLAPWDPPKKLVVSGPYQYSRNPMISGVSFILFGEAIVFSSFPLLIWTLSFTFINYIYFVIIEEPQLTNKFGDDYLEYKKHVPRLFPRRTPWKSK